MKNSQGKRTVGDQPGTGQGMTLIEDVGKFIAASVSSEATLQEVAHLVAAKLQVDVCSIYLLERDRRCLSLAATVGLNPESVGQICLQLDEGLTGLVLQRMAPVLVANAARHPNYKYFAGSGEENYHSFLGLPLVYHGETLGVLVVQTREEGGISAQDIPLFTTIASQIAGTAAYAALLRSLKQTEAESEVLKERLHLTDHPDDPPRQKTGPLKGIPVSGGFGEGYAYFHREDIGFSDIERRLVSDIPHEVKRFATALTQSEEQIFHLCNEMCADLSPDNVAILQAYLMYLRDGGLKSRVIDVIGKGYCAEYALKEVILQYTKAFARIEDPYLRERGNDIEIIGRRILRNLFGFTEEVTLFRKETILIANNISPAELLQFRQDNLRGIILATGGQTSHVTILARSFEIPMVIGVDGLADEVREEDFLILDGTSGFVFPSPSPLVVKEYQRLAEQKARKNELLDGIKGLPARTTDDFEVRLGANIGLLSDLALAERYGADHIGLYRTEFPFLSRAHFPSEEEQVNIYHRILKGAMGREVTFRTLDVGGDKFLSYMDYPKEENPYLGWRSIRVSLELQDVFREQIRAILRVSVHGPSRLLFPMITSVREIKAVHVILEEERSALKRQGIPFNETLPVGILVEVPAAVEVLPKLLPHADFISIGTNDLIQYVLAVDRNNQKVASLYNPLNPAVISIIHKAVGICRDKGTPVSVCGESAASPKSAYLYLGMGVDTLSMNAAAVPVIKHLIRHMTRHEAQAVLEAVLEMDDAAEIASYLDTRIAERLVV